MYSSIHASIETIVRQFFRSLGPQVLGSFGPRVLRSQEFFAETPRVLATRALCGGACAAQPAGPSGPSASMLPHPAGEPPAPYCCNSALHGNLDSKVVTRIVQNGCFRFEKNSPSQGSGFGISHAPDDCLVTKVQKSRFSGASFSHDFQTRHCTRPQRHLLSSKPSSKVFLSKTAFQKR